MPLLYSLIARGKVVLAEKELSAGNFPTIGRVLLNRVKPTDTKMSFVYDKYVFHYIVDNDVIYMCMADKDSKRRIPFAYLNDIKARFEEMYGATIKTAVEMNMNEEFSKVMEKRMEFFNNDPSADTITHVRGQIKEVKEVMVDNIDKVLGRGEKIEELADKTRNLDQQAFIFNSDARALKNQMWWQNTRYIILIVILVIVIIAILVISACGGFTFSFK